MVVGQVRSRKVFENLLCDKPSEVAMVYSSLSVVRAFLVSLLFQKEYAYSILFSIR